ncbi:MAG: hydrogenase maturation nickel metallochaperone HypA [Coriobacteriia bacterium]|nr:hydrogenase maturation nickel metallochaperone HypA [Coriobacteriia bacterium]
MHELSIATGVLDNVVKVATDNKAKSVKSINLVIGESRAVIAEALDNAFDALREVEDYNLCKNSTINTKYVEGHDIYIEQIEVES